MNDVACIGALLDEEPFRYGFDFDFDLDARFEEEDDEAFGVEEEPFADVEEGPVDDEVGWEAEFCATGADEEEACPPAVEDAGSGADPVDWPSTVEDGAAVPSVTGQTVV